MKSLSPKRNHGSVALAMNSGSQSSNDKKRRTGPSLHERKQQVVRDAIWDAATDLFAEKGFNEITVDDIAAAAGVSRRSFFRYFESKNDLMAHGMVSYGAELVAAIEACPKNCSLYEVFRETVLQVAQRAASHPRTPKIMAIVSKYPDAKSAQALRFAEVQDLVTQTLIKRCKKTGEDRFVAHILAGLIIQIAGLTLQWWFEEGQPNIADAVEHTFGTLSRLVCEGGNMRTGGIRP